MSEADIVYTREADSTPISSTDQSNTESTTNAPATEVSAGLKRLHVTNLPFRIRDSDLQDMFGVNSRPNPGRVGELVRNSF
jgi:hypothetical protein